MADGSYKLQILRRVFNILRENSPELVGFSLLTVIMQPQVLLEGTKKTIFVNFMDYCKTMRRQPAHVRAFLLAELGTTSDTPDAQQRLVVRGRFTSNNFEGLLRRYVCGYVMCFDCKSTNTTFSREVRLFFVRCEQCGSERCAPQIRMNRRYLGRRKTGYIGSSSLVMKGKEKEDTD
ncbi:PREDICTED: eukaryotic translation initiation factor 2 subunit beta-like [Camelina sativa]|uniref:Eukaryotic translation initiation factor 2 subunit beta-like n=1 Tax=Camelina sativa TaxID=90675 RepID=A0ABM0XR93_CAMSA|nr:PREDICTED: eukaryotic translation initiation factor 2 subunit beta-like [Camelina sativa]